MGKSAFEKLSNSIWQKPTESKLQMIRNFCLGGAATGAFIIFTLVGQELRSLSELVSISAASISTPFWFASAMCLENYIMVGPKSYEHLRSGFAQRYIALLMLVATTASVTAIGALILSVNWIAFACFCVASIVAFVSGLTFHTVMARNLFGKASSETDES